MCVCVFLEIAVFSNANSVDPDHKLRFVTSDLGLHCLPVTSSRDFPAKTV